MKAPCNTFRDSIASDSLCTGGPDHESSTSSVLIGNLDDEDQVFFTDGITPAANTDSDNSEEEVEQVSHM